MPTWLVIVILLLAVVPGAAMVLAGVIAMFFAPADYDLRRKRLAEGLCVHCGYDLRGHVMEKGSGLCPECGRPPFTSPDPAKPERDNGRVAPP